MNKPISPPNKPQCRDEKQLSQTMDRLMDIERKVDYLIESIHESLYRQSTGSSAEEPEEFS